MADHLFTKVDGIFFRGVDQAFRDQALSGSRGAGRYSRPGQPTLYLSSSPEGVAAAMVAHKQNRQPALDILEIRVRADRIFDLRDPIARAAAGIDLIAATSDWQELAASGGEPSSWKVRDRLEALGAIGLMDPSRKAPGLWHLVLFCWDSTSVQLLQPGSCHTR